MKNTKLTLSGIITFILSLWEFISPTAEVIFGIGSKGMAIIAFIITLLSFVYNYFSPNESLFAYAFRSIPGGGLPPPKDDDNEDDDEEDHINP